MSYMRLYRMVKNLVSRATTTKTDDSKGLQTLDIDGPLSGESHNGVIHHQLYGFSIHAPAGSVPLMLAVGGDRANLTAINPSHPNSRHTGLKEGEVVIYSQHGQKIYLKDDGTIEITGNTKIIGDLTVTGDVNLGGEGGAQVARIGDRTSDGARIVEGSTKVRAV